MMKDSTAMLSLAMLALLSFLLACSMSSIDPSNIIPALFSAAGVSYIVAIGINRRLISLKQ